MKHLKIIGIGLGVTALLVLKSCDTYLDQFNLDRLSTEAEISPSFAAPLAHGSFSIQDIFESLIDSSGLISLTEDSLILISYANAVYSRDAEGLFEIPPQVGTETYIKSDIEIPDWFIFPEGTVYTYEKIEKVEFGLDPEDKIDSLLIKSGDMIFDVSSQFRHPGEIVIKSENLVDPSGKPFNDTILISDASGNFERLTTQDLTGYKLILDHSNDSTFVQLRVFLTLIKSAAGIDDAEKAEITASFQDIKYSSLFGHIAERSITDLEQSIDLDFFSTIDNLPEIYFADPQINLYIDNSFGVPVTLTVNKFQGRSSFDGSLLDLDINELYNPFTVAAPTVEQIGQSIRSTLSYNVSTSKIDEFIAGVPDRIDFSFNAATGNPAGSTEQNFLLDTSKVDLTAEVLIPMWFSTTGYTLRDTLDTDISDLVSQLEIIKSINVRLTTTNEWPLELALQLYFLNDADTIVGSLFQEKTALIEAAPVDEQGELNRSALVENVLDIVIDEENLGNLENATKMMLVASVITSDEGVTPVKFYTSYLLNYKVGISAEFVLNSNDLNSN